MMNLTIKFRESFRPFAPSVLRADVSEYFDLDTDSPYMLLVARVVEPRRTPADAYRCFMRTEMDMLVLEDCIVYRSDQPPLQGDSDWRKEFELD